MAGCHQDHLQKKEGGMEGTQAMTFAVLTERCTSNHGRLLFAHDHWGRIGTKSIQDTYQTPYQVLHIHAPVDLYGIIFVQHQCGDLIRIENKICSVKPTFM